MNQLVFIIISVILSIFNFGLIFFIYYKLRNKQGPIGPRGLHRQPLRFRRLVGLLRSRSYRARNPVDGPKNS